MTNLFSWQEEDVSPPPDIVEAFAQDDAPPPLRDYQVTAVESVRRELKDNRGTLVLLATGLGKTQIACEIIRTWPGRCCFIAHRAELIDQAARRIEQFTGRPPEIEMATDRANVGGSAPVVASIQSLARERRIQRFAKDAFSLIVVDEVHHATAATYRAVLEYFDTAKVVGLTATADRLDGEAIGQVLDSVAHRYELPDAIRDGWLAPIKMRTIKIDSIDFSHLKTVAGDFAKGELDVVMAREEALHGVAKPAWELSGDRPTIVFTTSIDNARRLAEILDRYAGGKRVATYVDSTLDKQKREENLKLFESGERRFLVNVGIATEGYDHPPTSCVVLGRPTKSRALMVQMIGRGTRGGPRCPVEGKDDLLVIDFVGATGRFDLVNAVDALAGEESEEDAALIKAVIQKADKPMSFEEARAIVDERRRKERETEDARRTRRGDIKARVEYRAFDPNPFVQLGVKRDYLHERYGWAAATDKQMATIVKMSGKGAVIPPNLGKMEAGKLLTALIGRMNAGKCTLPQLRVLNKQGINGDQYSMPQASAVIDAIAKGGWRRIEQSTADAVAGVGREREPGEEG